MRKPATWPKTSSPISISWRRSLRESRNRGSHELLQQWRRPHDRRWCTGPSLLSELSAGYNVISPEYFSVMGIGMVGGRAFTDSDNQQGRDVAVISESTAKKFWPNQDPVGRTFRMASEKDRKLENRRDRSRR